LFHQRSKRGMTDVASPVSVGYGTLRSPFRNYRRVGRSQGHAWRVFSAATTSGQGSNVASGGSSTCFKEFVGGGSGISYFIALQHHGKVIGIAVTIRHYQRNRYHCGAKDEMWDEPSSTSMVAEAEVEVVALTAPDGSIRSSTRSILPSLLMTEEEDDEREEGMGVTIATSTMASRMNHLPCLVDKGTPALVRLQREEDCSDSEDSGGSCMPRSNATKSSPSSALFDDHRGASRPISSCHESVVVPATHISKKDSHSNATTHYTKAGEGFDLAVHHHDDGTVGAYDCLSDQFTNMFCSVVLCAQPSTLNVNASSAAAHSSTTAPSHNNSTTTLACVDEGCSAYPLPNYYDESDFGFASMPLFWLRIMNETGGKEDEFTKSIPSRPHNRSSGVGPKPRSKHLEGIWKTWHAAAEQEDCIPILERSKSLPDHLRATVTSSASASPVYCYHFNLDPEQEDFGYDSDPEQDYPHRKMGRAKELMTPQRVLKQQTSSYRDRRPQPIDTTMKVMTPTAKTVHEDSFTYLPPPPPPPPRRCHDGPSSPAFSFQRTEAKAQIPESKHNQTPTRRLRASLDPFSSVGPSPKDLMTPQGDMFLRTFIHVRCKLGGVYFIDCVFHRWFAHPRVFFCVFTTNRRLPIRRFL
jgi:hypothetical protein